MPDHILLYCDFRYKLSKLMNSMDSVSYFVSVFWKYKYCKETSVTRIVKLIKTVYWPHFHNFCAKKKNVHW